MRMRILNLKLRDLTRSEIRIVLVIGHWSLVIGHWSFVLCHAPSPMTTEPTTHGR
jgi:hypothetical protein